MPTLRLIAFVRRFTHAVSTEALRCELERTRATRRRGDERPAAPTETHRAPLAA